MTAIRNLHNFLDGLPDDARAAIDAVSRYRELAADERLMRAGVLPQELYQIESGRVKYSTWDSKGRESVLIYMSAGDWVGLSEGFTHLPTHWTVIAMSPVRVRVIRWKDFEPLLDRYPALARQLLKLFALRFSLHRLFGLDHSELSLKERLIKMLYFLSLAHDKAASDREPIVMKLSQEELCKVVGASRQKLNPALKALEREQLLEVQFGGVRLLSREAIVQRYGYLLNIQQSNGR